MKLRGKVFITGGAGFLARAIYRRALAEDWPAEFTAFSRDDAKHVALMRRFPNVRCVRGDVAGDRDLLAAAMRGHDTVIHAAAVKYVDLAETAVFDTVRVNVDGSRNVILAAVGAGVADVIAISTDKACEPVNIYGMTKAIMERMVIEAARLYPDVRFVNCRYGNVIGSTGSAIPKFREQLARTGRVDVTDAGMTRFWMPADEAVDTILSAMRAASGRTVIPVCRSMSLAGVVHAAIGDAAAINVIGPRPGEKKHEALVGAAECPRVGVGFIPYGRAVRQEDRFADYLDLYPPGEFPAVGVCLTPVTSETAPAMSAGDMCRHIEDAATI